MGQPLWVDTRQGQRPPEDGEPGAPREPVRLKTRPGPELLLLVVGIVTWALGVSQFRVSAIGLYGLLASASAWFFVGFAALLVGFLLELRRGRPRTWLLGLYLIALIVAIHATVPILFGAPQYAWVYKHIAVTQQLGVYGRVTDSTNIYQLWPTLFAGGAALASLGRIGPLAYTTWAPLSFELANTFLVLAIARTLSRDRRVPWLTALLFIGLISWVGQDYFSPQAFAYLLWLGIVLIVLRWLRSAPAVASDSRLARIRAPLVVGVETPPPTSRRARLVGVALVAVIYFAIVAAHQLTPYLALAGVGALTVLDLLRPRWLLVVMAAIAVGYLAPRYGLIAHDFGGLFSGGNPLTNAAGRTGTYHSGPEALTAWVVRALAGCMWLSALGLVFARRRRLGTVIIPAALAFSPFVLLGIQRYGGEAIYRVYLFSAPWCALLIAGALTNHLWQPRRWLLVGGIALACLAAGLQGAYGPIRLRAFTPRDVAASRWLYTHAPHGSLLVLAADDFPAPLTAGYENYNLQAMPADPQTGQAWLDESDLGAVERWIGGLGYQTAYVAVSHTMTAYADYFGAPYGYRRFVELITHSPGWSLVFRNSDAEVYRVNLGAAANVAPQAAPLPAQRVSPYSGHGHYVRRSGRWQLIGYVDGRWRRVGPGTSISWSYRAGRWIRARRP